MPLGFLELVAAFRDPSEYALQEPVEADAECCEDYDDYSVIQNICKALRHPHLSGKYVAEPFNERCHSKPFSMPHGNIRAKTKHPASLEDGCCYDCESILANVLFLKSVCDFIREF